MGNFFLQLVLQQNCKQITQVIPKCNRGFGFCSLTKFVTFPLSQLISHQVISLTKQLKCGKHADKNPSFHLVCLMDNSLLKWMQITWVKLLTYPIRLEVDISLQVIWLKISLMLSAGSRKKNTAKEGKYEKTNTCERKEQRMLEDPGRKCKRWLLTEKHGKTVQVLHHRFFGQVWSKIHNT